MKRTKDKLEHHYMDDVVIEAKLLYPDDKPAQRQYINDTLDSYLRDYRYQKMKEIEDEEELDDICWDEQDLASEIACDVNDVQPSSDQIHEFYRERQKHITP